MSSAAPSAPARGSAALALTLGVTLFAAILVRTAWLSDDAFITFRYVDNLFDGLGLRWNTAERVQSFTHPLWLGLLLLLQALTGELPITTMLASVALGTLTAALIAARLAGSLPQSLLLLLAMALSRSFVDYSTSGLENPLSHLLALLFFATSIGHASDAAPPRRLWLLAGLLALNRLDSLVLTGPTLALLIARGPDRRAGLRHALVGLAPLAAWHLFALFYYGFALPNTAYAKLNTGIPRAELLLQGGLYLLDSLSRDPVTLPLIALAAAVAVTTDPRARPAAAGALLYVGYVVWVGGDFMSGRFFSLPFAVGLVVLARAPLSAPGLPLAACAAALALVGLANPYPPPGNNASYFASRAGKVEHLFSASGINDERGVYFRNTGLLALRRGIDFPDHYMAEAGRAAWAEGLEIADRGALGMYGYFGGRQLHVLDPQALCDPLLSRLPAMPGWRVGHFAREIPAGYRRSVWLGGNWIRDPDLHRYYDTLQLVVRGPLWSGERLRAIADLHFGPAARQLDRYFAFHSRRRQVSLEELSTPLPSGAPIERGTGMSQHGLEVDLGGRRTAGELEVSLDGNDEYRVELWRSGRRAWHKSVEPAGEGLLPHRIQVPQGVAKAGYDALRVLPAGGDREFGLGYLLLRKP